MVRKAFGHYFQVRSSVKSGGTLQLENIIKVAHSQKMAQATSFKAGTSNHLISQSQLI